MTASVSRYEAIDALYDGVFPPYIIAEETNQSMFTVGTLPSDHPEEIIHNYITIQDVVYYYATRDQTSIATLAGIVGDRRMIDSLAQEAYTWFSMVNGEQLAVECAAQGLPTDQIGKEQR